ncbi:MAG TPA: DMT family transporter [Kofleriaceae bacterium]|nr:DMT family transporter [Kofleriaceae bacterium]
MERSRLPPLGLMLLALVAVGWGFAWPVIKIVLAEVPPLTYRGVCLVVGGAGVLGLARATGQSLHVPARFWGRLLAISACSIVGWNVLLVYGIALLSSGRAALLGYTMPLWSTALSIWLLGERLTARRGAALLLGMTGVVVLLGGDLLRMASAASGVALMLTAAMSWGLGVVLLKRFALPIGTGALTGWMMVVGGAPISVAAVVLEHARWRPVSTTVALGLVYSVVVAFMFCYWAWNRIVLMLPVTVSSVSALATPVIGVASGMWVLGEPLTWHEAAAGACILGAIALVLLSRASAAGPARRAQRGEA